MSDEKKKIVRLAVIRENTERGCPFGLHIPDACMHAGKLLDNMTPMYDVDKTYKLSKEEKARIVAANERVLMLSEEEPKQCKYANFIFPNEDEPEKSKVECNYGDSAAGIGVAPHQPAVPLSQYLGISFMSCPISFYNQDLTYADGIGGFSNRYFASEDKKEMVKEGETSSDEMMDKK